jgi:hypothetical protein
MRPKMMMNKVLNEKMRQNARKNTHEKYFLE